MIPWSRRTQPKRCGGLRPSHRTPNFGRAMPSLPGIVQLIDLPFSQGAIMDHHLVHDAMDGEMVSPVNAEQFAAAQMHRRPVGTERAGVCLGFFETPVHVELDRGAVVNTGQMIPSAGLQFVSAGGALATSRLGIGGIANMEQRFAFLAVS